MYGMEAIIAEKNPTSIATVIYWNGDVVAITTSSSLKILKTVFKITPAKRNPPTKNIADKTTPQYKRLRKSSKYGKNFSIFIEVLNYSSLDIDLVATGVAVTGVETAVSARTTISDRIPNFLSFRKHMTARCYLFLSFFSLYENRFLICLTASPISRASSGIFFAPKSRTKTTAKIINSLGPSP